MKDENDIMVRDIKEILETFSTSNPLLQAINIMYQIRAHKDKYFRIFDVDS